MSGDLLSKSSGISKDDDHCKETGNGSMKCQSIPLLNLNLSGLIGAGKTVVKPSNEELPSIVEKLKPTPSDSHILLDDSRKSQGPKPITIDLNFQSLFSNKNSTFAGSNQPDFQSGWAGTSLNSSILNDILSLKSPGTSLSLSDLAKQYTSPVVLENNLEIEKISTAPISPCSVTIEPNDFGLDLTNALRVKSDVEKRVPDMIKSAGHSPDVDLSPNCEMKHRDHWLWGSKFYRDNEWNPLKLTHASPFALIVCNQLSENKLPVVPELDLYRYSVIPPFDFNSPSPDDLVKRKRNGRAN